MGSSMLEDSLVWMPSGMGERRELGTWWCSKGR